MEPCRSAPEEFFIMLVIFVSSLTRYLEEIKIEKIKVLE